MKLKLFIAGWATNCGEKFALMKAASIEEAKAKIKGNDYIWDNYYIFQYLIKTSEDVKILSY